MKCFALLSLAALCSATTWSGQGLWSQGPWISQGLWGQYPWSQVSGSQSPWAQSPWTQSQWTQSPWTQSQLTQSPWAQSQWTQSPWTQSLWPWTQHAWNQAVWNPWIGGPQQVGQQVLAKYIQTAQQVPVAVKEEIVSEIPVGQSGINQIVERVAVKDAVTPVSSGGLLGKLGVKVGSTIIKTDPQVPVAFKEQIIGEVPVGQVGTQQQVVDRIVAEKLAIPVATAGLTGSGVKIGNTVVQIPYGQWYPQAAWGVQGAWAPSSTWGTGTWGTWWNPTGGY